MTSADDYIHIIPSTPSYAHAQESTMSRVYNVDANDPNAEIFTAAMFCHQQRLFPEGQFIALHKGRIVGLTVSMRLPFDPENPFIESWFTTISMGWLHRHDPGAAWMYGVESCVLPDYQSRGVGGALMQARFDVARDLNLRGIVAGSALISMRANAESHGMIAPAEYIRQIVTGDLYDRNLTKQIKKGFVPLAVIPNYLHDDDSMGFGAVIVWHNPDYDPARGRVTSQRRYKVALKTMSGRV